MSMTDEEVIREMRSNSPLNRFRAEFTNQVGKLEQAELQREKPTPLDRRRMEFEAASFLLEIAKSLHG